PSSARRVLHVEVDVEDQVADLLHRALCRPIRAGAAAIVALAAVAIVDRRPLRDLLPYLRRDRHKLEAAGGLELVAQQVVEHVQPPFLSRGRRFERRVDQGEAEEGDAGNAVAGGKDWRRRCGDDRQRQHRCPEGRHAGPPYRGRSERPIRNSSTARAHWRPSRIAQTTSDWPRLVSPAAKTLGTVVA